MSHLFDSVFITSSAGCWRPLTGAQQGFELSLVRDHADRPAVPIRRINVVVLTAIRGRGNWTFFGSDGGGKTAAVLRNFIASCKRSGIEPFAWFRDVLSRIPASRLPD